jgi:hypothetical protein
MTEEAVAALTGAELGEDGRAALPFVAAAAGQLAAPLEVGGRAPAPGALREASERVLGVLRAAAAPVGGPEAAGARLAADPRLAAVFFQNVDLLYGGGFRHADAVSLAVMHALGLMEGGASG